MNSGETYKNIQKTISITLIDNWTLLGDEEDVHNIYVLKNQKSNKRLTDVLEFHFIELSKFNNETAVELQTRFERWLYFLKYMPMLSAETEHEITKEEGIKMAVAAYKRVTHDRIVREKFAMQKKHELDYLSGMQSAKEEGKKLGIEEGKRETARALKAQSISAEIIARATGLSLEEVAAL